MPGYELIGDEEFAEVKTVFDSGGVLFRHGFEKIRNECFKVKEFERDFAKYMGSQHALAVTSGTAALRVALAALGIGPGDEVITQSFTFVATVEAIIESGATPICANIDKTLNMDPKDLLGKITSKTKAVIVVHMLGVPARVDQISEICKIAGIPLVEDVAWGCGGSIGGVNLGTWGDVGTFSFDYAKTMTTGEGGMLLFKEESVFKKAAAWHDHGHENNPNYPRWEDSRASSGFNFRMMELQGAIGLAQLKKLSSVICAQRDNRDKIVAEISLIEGIELRDQPKGSFDTADALIFYVQTNLLAKKCRESLLISGISTKILPEAFSWHFAGTWTHMPELMGENQQLFIQSLSSSADILSKAVSLPINVFMPNNYPVLIRQAIENAIQNV